MTPFPPPPDGIGAHSKFLAGAWRTAGHTVHVATRSAPYGHAAVDGLHVHRVLGSGTTPDAVLDAARPDVVLVQFAVPALTTVWPAALRLMARARARGAVVLTAFHEPVRELEMLRSAGPLVYRRVVRHTDVCVVFTEQAAELLRSKGIADPQVVPLGVPTLPKASRDELERIYTEYVVTDRTVLSLGFLHPDKGTDVLADALVLMRSRGVLIDVLVAGAVRQRRGVFLLREGADRRFERALQRSDAGVTERFRGFVPDEDLAPLLLSVGAMVLPYRKTTQSGVAGLALAAGLAVVASDLDGLRATLGNAALYAAPGDPSALADALTALTDPRTWTSLRRKSARRRAGMTFDVVGARLLELADRSRPPAPSEDRGAAADADR